MRKIINTLLLLCVFVLIQKNLTAQPPAVKYDNSNYPVGYDFKRHPITTSTPKF